MAKGGQRLLADIGWLSEPLRLTAPDAETDATASADVETDDLPEFLAGDDQDEDLADDEDEARQMIAAGYFRQGGSGRPFPFDLPSVQPCMPGAFVSGKSDARQYQYRGWRQPAAIRVGDARWLAPSA